VHFVIVKKEPRQSTHDALKFMPFNWIQKTESRLQSISLLLNNI